MDREVMKCDLNAKPTRIHLTPLSKEGNCPAQSWSATCASYWNQVKTATGSIAGVSPSGVPPF